MRKRVKPIITRRIMAGMAMEGKRAKDMCKLFGITEQCWYGWLRDPLHYLTLYRVSMIAAALHTTPVELIREEVEA